MRIAAVVLGLFSLAVFLVSLLTHVLSFIPGVPLALARVWPLHLGAMAAFFGMIVHAALLQSRAGQRDRNEGGFQTWLEGFVPRAVWVLGGVLFCYALVNFGMYAVRSEGQADVRNGEFVLMNRTRVVRVLTADEYREHRRYETRGPSGHWMLFGAVPAAYFLIVYPRARAAPAGADADRPVGGVL